MQSTSLPSHRALLTNLITSFYARSQAGLGAAQDDANPATTSAVHSGQRRRLLLTLHVIFPGMLLPAVDLLDRKLVTRMRYVDAAARPVSSSQGDGAADEPAAPDTPETMSVYAVKSVSSTLSRRRRDAATAGPPRTYLVHLDAWNCSCAGFALEAFPGGGGEVEGGDETLVGEDGTGKEGWTFGGMSRDDGGRWGETLPCCKHLLACLLADKWRDVLNVHVEDKTCTREELAGIAAGL